jgi:hypothetical protein
MHSSGDPARVWIEVDVEAGSIAGALHRGDDPVRQFVGWLELVSLIEGLRPPASDCDPSAPATGPP